MSAPLTRRSLLTAAATLAAPAIVRADAPTAIEFYFPIAVGGPIAKLVDALAADFMKENPDLKVTPIYAGGYVDTLTKAMTATKSGPGNGQGPAMAVTLAVDAFALVDDELIVPIDEVATSAEDRAWLDGFYPAFMQNGRLGGHTWGVPFQRSTVVMYWNKDAFREAGLDPEHAPASWEELVDAAVKTTKKEGDRVARWGVQVPGDGLTYWLYQGFAAQAGVDLANPAGTAVNFDDPGAVEALQFWIDLTTKYHAHPPGIVAWGSTPRDFLEGKVAIIWHTSGNLTNIRNGAKFPFGVATLPAHKRPGSPTGGGNFHLFKGADAAQRAASLRFLRWVTKPERVAQWSIDTGYVATRPDAWDTPAMRAYLADFPAAAVLREQLKVAVPELATHDDQRVIQALDTELQGALTGAKTAKTALDTAQAAATRMLRPYAK